MKLKSILLSILLLSCVLFAQPERRLVLSEDELNRGIYSTPQIIPFNASDNLVDVSCSSTYVGDGLILTNYHCIGCADYGGCAPHSLKFGEKFSPDGKILVLMSKTPYQPPVPSYTAKYVTGEAAKDVAVLRIDKTFSGLLVEPSSISMPAIAIGDSMAMHIGNPIYVIGYPNAGYKTITYTDGKIAGFLDLVDPPDEVDTFKVTAVVNHGNSGGLLMNDKGEQVGIPQFIPAAGQGTGVNGCVMIHIAVPYIEQAKKLQATKPDDSTVKPPVTTPTPTTTATFGAIIFGTDYKDGKVVNSATSFPAGTKKVSGYFDYTGMLKATTVWGWTWYYNDAVYLMDAGISWKYDDIVGTQSVYVQNENGLASGKYDLELFLNGISVQKSSFTIEAESTKPPSVIPSAGVTCSGRVIDALTGQGIPNAYVQFSEATDSMAISKATAATDLSGNFTTAPPLQRNIKYNIDISAAGYRTRMLYDTFTDADADLLRYKDWELDKN